MAAFLPAAVPLLGKALAFAKGLTGLGGVKAVAAGGAPTLSAFAKGAAAKRFAGDALVKAGSMMPKSVGQAAEAIIGKEMLANKQALLGRLAPDAFYGGLAMMQTPGDLGDKLIAGGTQFVGGGLGGLTAARGLKKVMPKAGDTLLTGVDFGGSILGDYAGMAAGDALMRGKDKLMGGEGLNPYERMGAEQQAAYKQQIEQDMLMKLGLINPYQQDYFANQNGLSA